MNQKTVILLLLALILIIRIIWTIVGIHRAPPLYEIQQQTRWAMGVSDPETADPAIKQEISRPVGWAYMMLVRTMGNDSWTMGPVISSCVGIIALVILFAGVMSIERWEIALSAFLLIAFSPPLNVFGLSLNPWGMEFLLVILALFLTSVWHRSGIVLYFFCALILIGIAIWENPVHIYLSILLIASVLESRLEIAVRRLFIILTVLGTVSMIIMWNSLSSKPIGAAPVLGKPAILTFLAADYIWILRNYLAFILGPPGLLAVFGGLFVVDQTTISNKSHSKMTQKLSTFVLLTLGVLPVLVWLFSTWVARFDVRTYNSPSHIVTINGWDTMIPLLLVFAFLASRSIVWLRNILPRYRSLPCVLAILIVIAGSVHYSLPFITSSTTFKKYRQIGKEIHDKTEKFSGKGIFVDNIGLIRPLARRPGVTVETGELSTDMIRNSRENLYEYIVIRAGEFDNLLDSVHIYLKKETVEADKVIYDEELSSSHPYPETYIILKFINNNTSMEFDSLNNGLAVQRHKYVNSNPND